MRQYCKLLYNELSIEFTKRASVIIAITGSAAVNIHSKTMYSIPNWEQMMAGIITIMVIVDDIS